MIRVTADTNIIISGMIFPHGKPFQLLELAREGKINLSVSVAILDEMSEVLVRKFRFTDEEVAEARRRIRAIARTVTPAVELNVVKEDADDNRILECAVSAGSDYIVSGDKDLLRLGRYDSIGIVSPSDLLDLLNERHRTL